MTAIPVIKLAVAKPQVVWACAGGNAGEPGAVEGLDDSIFL